MKKLFLTSFLAATLFLQSCIFTSTEMVVNTTNAIAVASQFDSIVYTISKHRKDFTKEEWEKLNHSKIELQSVALLIQSSGVASTEQLRTMRDAVKMVYMGVRPIVQENLSKFTLLERIQLLEFDKKLIALDDMLTQLDEHPTTENAERILNLILELSKLIITVLPLVL